jgi:Golgi SNAP receptor complex protein 1
LRELNRQLLSAGSGVSSSITQQHMGRLQTYSQDFHRVHARISDAWNSAQLRRGATRPGGAQDSRYGNEMQNLMDEHNAGLGAHRAADRVLAQASAAHADLEGQRRREQSIASRLTNIGRSVPGLNSLMTRIRGRRERDRLILAGCIGTCITLIIIYSLR